MTITNFNDGDERKRVPSFGEKRWSDYFNSYVIMHLFISDDTWYFTLPHDEKVYKAEVRWSHLRDHKDSQPI